MSGKLTQSLNTTAGVTYIAYASCGVLEIFFGWLFRRQIEDGTQLSLVKAWRLGTRYEIVPFQNDIMHSLVDNLHENPVDPVAAREAYYDLSFHPILALERLRTREVLKLLQQAFAI